MKWQPVTEHDDVGEFGEYLPSPAEIRRACREIQRQWTPAERQQRVVQQSRLEIPVVHVPQRLRHIRAD